MGSAVRRSRSRRSDSGTATAEMAVALPALVLALAAALWAVLAGAAQVRCLDAAREGARVAARGDSEPLVLEAARRAAPAGAVVTVNRDGDLVRVSVRAEVSPVGNLVRRAPSLSVHGSATAAVEARLAAGPG